VLYSRAQLWLLLGASLALLAGLAVRQWRAGFPELAERLERFDREAPAPAPAVPLTAPAPPPGAGPRQAGRSAAAATAGPGGATTAGQETGPVDLNRAAVEDLARLPGVGESLARRIIGERERVGRFESVDDLQRVLGIGPRRLTALRESVRVTVARRADSTDPQGRLGPGTALAPPGSEVLADAPESGPRPALAHPPAPLPPSLE
jgi:competence protein ComEA